MRIYDLIAKKRDGGTHSREELEVIVNGFVRGEVADYQMAAWISTCAAAAEEYRSGLAYGAEKPAEDPLVYTLVTKDGVERY